MIRIVASILLGCVCFTSVYAQTDSSSFLIQVFGAEDTVVPTTPALSGVVIADTQIDLTWTPAIDNFLVSGYVLFKNGMPIATTTLTTYTDSGLNASTSYSYFVRAFDASLNYSSSSNTVLLTTFAAPLPPTSVATSSSGATATRVVLNSLTVTPAEQSALFLVQTVRPARFTIRWGRTTSYELGYTVNDVYLSQYQTTIRDLEPGTTYQYEVIGYTPRGVSTILEKGQFSTIGLSDIFPPTNVSSFVAQRHGTDVKLSWDLPTEADVASVRIVRSHLGFPRHSEDGVVVYQGLAENVVDEAVLEQYSPVYYTAFVVDVFGTVSSGAVARVYAVSDGGVDDGIFNPPIPSGIDGGVVADTVASTSPNLPVGTRIPSLEEIFLVQQNIRQSLGRQNITLNSEMPFLLSIPKQSVSDTLKTILASLTDPTDSRRTYSFMLRLNKDQTAYEAVLPPVLLQGKSRLIIDIYDYQSLIVANYQKTVTFVADETRVGVPIFPDKIMKGLYEYGWIAAIPVGGFSLWLLMYRRRSAPVREDNP